MERPTLRSWVLCECCTSNFPCLGLSLQTTHQASHHSASRMLVWPRVRGCTFLFVVGKCSPPQHSGWLVSMFCCCHHEDFIGARTFYGVHALAYPLPRFSDMSGPETKASPTIFEKCGGKLARKGRDTTPWDQYRMPLPKPFRMYRFRHRGSKSDKAAVFRLRSWWEQ